MAAVIATVVVALMAIGVGYWAGNALMRKHGQKTMRELPPAKRRMFWLSLGVGLAIAAFEGWAFKTHHGAVGVVVLIVVFVLPEFVLIPLRIRRSHRAAERSRARRTGSRPT